MSVKIRLTRLGDAHAPFYRVVVADSRSPRDGKFVEILGTYNPLKNPAEIKIDLSKVETWVKNGALPTDTAKSILVKAGFIFPIKAKKAKKAQAKKTETKAPAAKKPATAKKAKAE